MRNHVHGSTGSSLKCDDSVCHTACDFMYDLMRNFNKASDLSPEVSK